MNEPTELERNTRPFELGGRIRVSDLLSNNQKQRSYLFRWRLWIAWYSRRSIIKQITEETIKKAKAYQREPPAAIAARSIVTLLFVIMIISVSIHYFK
jgi:hypothetical protein